MEKECLKFRKQIIALLVATSFALSGCGSAATAEPESAPEEETSSVTEETAAEEASDTASLSDIEVEDNLYDVVITIPADYIDATTQEELDEAVKEYGFKAVLNDDGSATYTMTKAQHQQILDDMSDSIHESLDEMVGSEDYPNITDITVNDDFTEYTVSTKNTEPDLMESIAASGFYMYSGIYYVFEGSEPDNIHVEFINADSGEVISSSDSKDLGE